jgi:hypothetical protein
MQNFTWRWKFFYEHHNTEIETTNTINREQILGLVFAFLVIWGYRRVGIQKQAHVLVYVVIAICCIMSSLNAFFVSIG